MTRILAAAALLALAACGVGEDEDLSGYYASRRLGNLEGLCLFPSGTFVYWSPQGEKVRVQRGNWQAVLPYTGSLVAILDSVRLYRGAGGVDPGALFVSRRTVTRRLELISASQEEVRLQRKGPAAECLRGGRQETSRSLQG